MPADDAGVAVDERSPRTLGWTLDVLIVLDIVVTLVLVLFAVRWARSDADEAPIVAIPLFADALLSFVGLVIVPAAVLLAVLVGARRCPTVAQPKAPQRGRVVRFRGSRGPA